MEECQHKENALRLRTLSNGAITIQRQCIHCGDSIGGAVSKKGMSAEQISTLAPWDNEMQAETSRKREQYWAEIRAGASARIAEQDAKWWAWYNDYLRSESWHRKRIIILERDKYECQGCLQARASQVHHLTYDHVGDELLFELTSLCVPCHEKAHTRSPHSCRRAP